MTSRISIFVTCVLFTLAEPVAAQARGRAGILRPGRGANRPAADALQGEEVPAQRRQLEQQIRRSLWRAAKVRIGFSDDQMSRLEQTSTRFDQRRRSLALEEKAVRVSLRQQMLADSSGNQASITTSLDRLQQFQRQRIDLQAEEQKEFATFMTPLQRAKFTALQEQVRRRMQELIRARPDSAAVPETP